MPGDAVVQRCDTITDRCVQLDEREEPDVAQLGDNPARRDLHGDLDLRLVARFSRPCRHNGRVVVHRHFGIGTIDARLVEAGLGDAGLQIVGNHHRRHTAVKAKGACVRADPVGQRLREGCLGVRKARCTECGDKQLAGKHLSGRGVHDVDRRAGVIDEQLLAGHMGLPHRRR